jgi:hypothetical protein
MCLGFAKLHKHVEEKCYPHSDQNFYQMPENNADGRQRMDGSRGAELGASDPARPRVVPGKKFEDVLEQKNGVLGGEVDDAPFQKFKLFSRSNMHGASTSHSSFSGVLLFCKKSESVIIQN